MKKISTFLKDLFFPKKCYFCRREGDFLCIKCKNNLDNYEPFCFVCHKANERFKIHKSCKKEDIFFDRVIVFTHYKNKGIAKLIKNAKYYGKRDIFIDFGLYLAEILSKNVEIGENNVILTFSPMSRRKKFMRGYNQAEVIAKEIGEKLNLHVCPIVSKIKNTKSQAGSTINERKVNLKNAFEVDKKYIDSIKGKKIVIVDDVITTGSTLNFMSKELKKYTDEEIIGLVIASN